MPKPIIDWKGRSRKIPYMCIVCGKKFRTKKEAYTCEWADRKGISKKAAERKQTKERKRENENNISDQSERRCGKDNNRNQHGSVAGESLGGSACF